jgi:integrase/recombinase XerD
MISGADRWLAWMRVERGLIESTILGYQRELRALEASKGSLENLTTQNLRDYLVESGGSASTVAGRIAAMRSYYGFLVRSQVRLDDPSAPLDRPKLRRGLPKPVPNREVAFATLELDYQHIATVLVETGLRISEGVALNVAVPAPEQTVVRGKGAKERIVLLTPKARTSLDALGGTLKYQVRTIQRRFKVAGFTPHQLRHTLACDLAASGADLGEIQEILGHSSPATTRVYAAYGTDRLKKAHERRAEMLAR